LYQPESFLFKLEAVGGRSPQCRLETAPGGGETDTVGDTDTLLPDEPAPPASVVDAIADDLPPGPRVALPPRLTVEVETHFNITPNSHHRLFDSLPPFWPFVSYSHNRRPSDSGRTTNISQRMVTKTSTPVPAGGISTQRSFGSVPLRLALAALLLLAVVVKQRSQFWLPSILVIFVLTHHSSHRCLNV